MADVICWQECINAEVRARLRRALPDFDHATFNGRDLGPGMNSISWRRSKVRIVGEPTSVHASDARAFVSPERFVNGVVLEAIGGGQRFAALNVHFISLPSASAFRAEQWANNMRVLRETIHDLRARGLPVLVGGDFNRQTWDLIGPPMVEPRYRDEGPTVDRIVVTPEVTVLRSWLGLRNGSNHQPVIARLTIP